MKIVRLQGGLGNQMFQYAFGKVLGNNVYYDISWFSEMDKNPMVTKRTYGLDFFKMSVPLIDIRIFQNKSKIRKILERIFFQKELKKIIEHPENIYNQKIIEKKRGIFEGYFQVASYYDKIRAELLQDFIPSTEMDIRNKKVYAEIKKYNSISLHIRRGDYLKYSEIYGVCDLNYYLKAIKFIEKQIKSPHFFVFFR